MIFDQIWKLRRQRKHIGEAYEEDIRAAKNIDERQNLESEQWLELDMIDDQIRGQLTRRLQEKARNLDIPIPSDGESWVHSQTTGISYLRDKIRHNLKREICEDGKERRSFWKDIFLLATGIVAIVSSIWSILKK